MFFSKRLKKLTPEQEEERRQEIAKEDLTWKDRFAMVFSAYVVLLVPSLLILLAICLVALLIFGIL